jgi:hypothetical protein
MRNPDNTQLPNWNWNFAITNQAVQDHAEKLLVEMSQAIPRLEPDHKVVFLHCIIATAQRLIEREENTI